MKDSMNNAKTDEWFWGEAEVEVYDSTRDPKEKEEIRKTFTKFVEKLGLKVKSFTWVEE